MIKINFDIVVIIILFYFILLSLRYLRYLIPKSFIDFFETKFKNYKFIITDGIICQIYKDFS